MAMRVSRVFLPHGHRNLVAMLGVLFQENTLRIRTVKPEFWKHPIMGRLSGDLKALAIGLLNLADDEGFFMADPMIIRAELMPYFEGSLSEIHGMLNELSMRAQWILIRTHKTHGQIGKVLNFEQHQKVNRPTPSKLLKYWEESELTDDSMSPHGSLITGTGNREQGKDQGNKKTRNSSEPAASAPIFVSQAAKKYLDIFNAVFSRRVGARTIIEKKIAARMKAGIPDWQIFCAPILQLALDSSTPNVRNFSPEMLLRDGSKARTSENGATHGATDWIERIYLNADKAELDERLTSIAKHFELTDFIEKTGAKIWTQQ